MLTLQLEALFTPELLTAYRETWGHDSKNAARFAAEIIGMFESPNNKKETFLRDVALALVGEEPDLHAWAAAFASGSFELRPETTYGRAPGKGSPSRFVKRQRELIDSLIDKRLSEAERVLRRLAYQDALQLIVASMLVRELRIGVAAKAAIGTGWPVMVAVNDHLQAAEKRDLQSFGGNLKFQGHLARSVSNAIASWIDSPLCNSTLLEIQSPHYASQLPPGVNTEAALAYLDRGAPAVHEYRNAILKSFGLELEEGTSGSLSPEERASTDAASIGSACSKRFTASDDISCANNWLHFDEARWGKDPFTYNAQAIERLRLYLPILSAPKTNMTALREAASQSRARLALREELREHLPDFALQTEIHTWASSGLPPPSTLKPEHAQFFEQDACEKWRVYPVWPGKWDRLGFGPLYAEADLDPREFDWPM